MTDAQQPSLSPIRTGLACRCPRCGKGRLFQGFLDLRPRCEACGLDYSFIDSGDGPAVFVIMLAGLVVVACALIVEVLYQPPFWLHALLWVPADPGDHAAATAAYEGPDDRRAISSQSRRGPLRAGRQGRQSVNEPVNAAERRRGMLVPGVLALVALVVLIGLGTWQVERKAWKEALIETLTKRLNADPVALPPPGGWARNDARRLGVPACHADRRLQRRRRCTGLHRRLGACATTSNRPVTSCLRPPACRMAARSWSTAAMCPAGRIPALPARRTSSACCAGRRLRRGSSPPTMPRAASGIVRDQRAMAQLRGWGAVAPFYLEQEAPVPPGGLPHPAPLKVRLRNEHLQYAITWYGLAIVLVFMSIIFMLRRRRDTPV